MFTCMSRGKRFGLGLVQIGLIIEGKDKEDTCESVMLCAHNMYLCACLKVSGTLLDHVWL